MIRSGDRIPTGTGKSRRRLTLEEAQAGGLPDPFTPEEWAHMYKVCAEYHNSLIIKAVNNDVHTPKHPKE